MVTLYATLGIEALIYGINQTKTKFLITSSEQLFKLEKIIKHLSTVTHVIVMFDKFSSKAVDDFKTMSMKEARIKSFKLEEVVDIGATSPLIQDYEKPQRDDLG